MSGNNHLARGNRPLATPAATLLVLLCSVCVALFVLHPWSAAEKLFAIGYGLDPQRPSHTYFLGGRQLPLEARKLGMFGGFLLTCVGLLAAGRARAAAFPPGRIVLLLLAFIAAMGLDGLNATFFDLGWPHLYAPDLRLRLATGLLSGVAMAGLLLPAVNGSLWRELHFVPSVSTGRQITGVVLLCISFFLMVDARPALLYYPVGLIGVAGLLLELTLINMVFVLALARRAGTVERTNEAVPAIAGALLLTVCELTVMSLVRYVTLGDVTSLM